MGALNELLYAGDLVLLSETIEVLRNKFLRWKEAFESKGFKVNLGKTKVMVSCGITKDGMSKSKVYPSGVCSLRVKVKMLHAKNVKGILEGQWSRRKSYVMKLKL